MKQVACKLCNAPFVCDNGRWFTTCTCAKDRPEELRAAQEQFDRDCPNTRPQPLNDFNPLEEIGGPPGGEA